MKSQTKVKYFRYIIQNQLITAVVLDFNFVQKNVYNKRERRSVIDSRVIFLDKLKQNENA
jgi:hypothetical protein